MTSQTPLWREVLALMLANVFIAVFLVGVYYLLIQFADHEAALVVVLGTALYMGMVRIASALRAAKR